LNKISDEVGYHSWLVIPFLELVGR